MLKLKLQYFGHLMQRANLLEKTLMLGKTEDRRGWQRMRCLDGITDSVDMILSKLWELVKERKVWRAAVHGVTKSWTQLNNWTEWMVPGKRGDSWVLVYPTKLDLPKGEWEDRMNWELAIDMYTLLILYIKYATNENVLRSTGNYSMPCGVLNKKEIQKRGHICESIDDSLCFTVVTNTTL